MPIKVRSGGAWVQVAGDGADGQDGAGGDSIPAGTIVMYNGDTAPTGWSLCDGGGGRPDLRDKFIVGSGNSYNTGNQGGSANTELVAHTHYGPVHDHPINTSFNINASGTTSVDDVPHTHPVAGTVGTGSGLNAGADYTGNYSPRSTNAATDTNHSHTFTINTTASLSGSTSNSGNLETSNAYDGNGNTAGGGSGGNLPPYYALCYIIKNDASLYLKSPNGTSFRLSVDNSGNVSATSV